MRKTPLPDYPAELISNRGTSAVYADGVRVCADCAAPVAVASYAFGKGYARRCSACNAARYAVMTSIRSAAAAAVAKAKKDGQLRPATDFVCVDCQKPAVDYDHRDYTQPLAVVPVCRSCNCKRGPADVWVKTAAKAEA